MAFSSIRLYQYRNLADSDVVLSGRDILLVGENGQGKTNFLEAVYMLCFGSSFRGKVENLVSKSGTRDVSVAAEAIVSGEKRRILFKMESGKKTIELDGKKITDRKILLQDFPCIIFCHDDIRYVDGSPDRRRLFLNQTISLFDMSYIDSLRNYNRIVKLRNAALKSGRSELVDVYDIQMIEPGLEIQRKRTGLLSEFNETFTKLFRHISGLDLNLEIRYFPSWKCDLSAESAAAFIAGCRRRDADYGMTTSGPHRDRIGFYCGNRNFASVASTGQIRLISLVLKAAQAVFFSGKTGKLPVLLLDDVMLELDLPRRRRFLDALPEYDQAFFTFLPDESLVDLKSGALLFDVEEGRLEARER